MPQKSPAKLPTITRLLTGTIVKFTRDTRGQSFKPDIANGQKPYVLLSAGFFVWGEGILDMLETYSLTVAYNSLSVLALEGTHYRNEQQCVNSRSQCLVQGEFLGCVGLAEPFLSIDICCICRKLLF